VLTDGITVTEAAGRRKIIRILSGGSERQGIRELAYVEDLVSTRHWMTVDLPGDEGALG
jgi:hypothetical protein